MNYMFREIKLELKTAFITLILLTIITGLIYPLLITGLAQLLFPFQANGSIIFKDQIPVGSRLIGQSFSQTKYFFSRPSATTPEYNGGLSQGSSMGPLNKVLLDTVQQRIAKLKNLDPTNKALIPVDLVTASGSGLDPEISPYAALYQAPRIAMARSLKVGSIVKLIENHIQPRSLYLLGEPRVNVLELNIALDTQKWSDND